jgi:uncharacterized protein YuzE
MSQISLIATDLDGTLLTSDGQITPATCSAIQKAQKQGIPVILATTRNLSDVQKFCQTLTINDPIICTNGAQVLASPQGLPWANLSIPQEIALKVTSMKARYLEVTFRKGKPLAAYLYLPREPNAKSVNTEDFGSGLLVDYQADGIPIGLEITAPTKVTLDQINTVLSQLNLPLLEPQELIPLKAA